MNIWKILKEKMIKTVKSIPDKLKIKKECFNSQETDNYQELINLELK